MISEIELTAWEEFEDGSDQILRVNVEYEVEWLDGDDGKMGKAINILGATYLDEIGNEQEYLNVRENEDDWIDEILRLTGD